MRYQANRAPSGLPLAEASQSFGLRPPSQSEGGGWGAFALAQKNHRLYAKDTETALTRKGICDIRALIIEDRKNLKGIIIGKQGSMLKKIGSLAREELETYLGMKVYLELFVKTIEDWKNKEEMYDYLKISEKDL